MASEKDVLALTQYQGVLILADRSLLYEPRNVVGQHCNDVAVTYGTYKTAKTTNIATCLGVAIQAPQYSVLIHSYTPQHLHLLLERMAPEIKQHCQDYALHVLSRVSKGVKLGAHLPHYDEVLDFHGLLQRTYHVIDWTTKLRVGKKNPTFRGACVYLSNR